MPTYHPLFAHPFYAGDDAKDVTIGGVPRVMSTGTYPCVPAYMAELAYRGGITAAFNTDGKVVLSDSGTFAVTWDDVKVRNILGFTGNLSGASSYTATYTPLYCWVPGKVRGDFRDWIVDHEMNTTVTEAEDGSTPGLSTGVEVVRLDAQFAALYAWLIAKSRARSDFEQDRSLDTFVENSRVTNPGASGEPAPCGFYFFPSIEDAPIDRTVANWDSGDATKFNYTSGAETFAFCSWDANFSPAIDSFVPVRSDYGNVATPFHTSPAGDWTAP